MHVWASCKRRCWSLFGVAAAHRSAKAMFAISFLLFSAPLSLAAQDRFALVVGIDSYTNISPLRKAVNDARAIATTLQSLGFEVTLATDSTNRDLSATLDRFVHQVTPGSEVIFFFAGHGIEVEKVNYLVAADAEAVTAGERAMLRQYSQNADELLSRLVETGARKILVIIDACRNNPFPRQGTRSPGGERGLAEMASPEGVYLIFSAAPGQTALDVLDASDPDANSVFTRAFLRHLRTPGLELRDLMIDVRSDVRKLAATVSHKQMPETVDRLDGRWVLSMQTATAPAPEPISKNAAAECIALAGSRISDDELYNGEPIGQVVAICAQAASEDKRNAEILHAYARAVDSNDQDELARPIYLAAADLGNSSSMFRYAEMLKWGAGGDVWKPGAFEYFKRAADAGHVNGMVETGFAYQYGEGIAVDYNWAFSYYMLARNAGSAAGANNLGTLYQHGHGTAPDQETAELFYTEAAKADNREGLVNYALLVARKNDADAFEVSGAGEAFVRGLDVRTYGTPPKGLVTYAMEEFQRIRNPMFIAAVSKALAQGGYTAVGPEEVISAGLLEALVAHAGG